MTFLELCQDLVREAGISGSIASVLDQTGEAGRVVNWIKRAYARIQATHAEWEFLRADVQFNALLGVAKYAPADVIGAGFGKWSERVSWRAYLTASGAIDEQPLSFVPYAQFRDRYQYGAQRSATGRPTVFTEAPNQSIIVWPVPDALYTIVGEQFHAPLALAANGDVPVFAARFHEAILWRALMYYAEYEGDASVFSSAQSEFNRVLAAMESTYLPEWDAPGAMA